MEETRFSLGIDFEKGAYLKAPGSFEEVGRRVEEWTREEAEEYARRRDRLTGAAERPLLPGYRVDVNDLAQTGWGVVFAERTDPAVREALASLLDYRKRQATGLLETGYREIPFQANDTRETFLSRWGVGAGSVVNPRKLPYYLLLVGSPRQIPFEVQYELAIDYAVGRLWFDTPEEYARYARTVLEAEAGRLAPRRQAVLFGTAHEGDPATQACSTVLVRPLSNRLRQECPEWSVDTVIGPQATKARLAGLLTQGPPALLLAAGHATLLRRSNPYQRELQGALLCEGWKPGTGAKLENLFTAADLPAGADLQGLVAFLFACSSAGTPDHDDFYGLSDDEFLGADEPFVSRLPQRLLTQGAAAVIGHVDRVWKASFLYDRHQDDTGDIAIFEEVARFLLDGYRAGHAMSPLARRYAALSAGVANRCFELRRGQAVDPEQLGELWLRSNDARNYLLLGDPAARLPRARLDAAP